MTLNEKSPAASGASRETRYAILPDRMPPIPTGKMTDAQKKAAFEIAAGLNPAIAEAIAEGRRPAAMAADEEILYDFVTELLANKGVSDATYARTVAKFGEPGIIDIVGIVGYYTMLAMIMNVARTPLLEGRPFPLAPTPIPLRPLAGSPLRT